MYRLAGSWSWCTKETLCGMGPGQNEGPEPTGSGAPTHDRSRCAEHEGVVPVRHACARHTGGSHVRTTRALALLMSIAISLENTKRPESRTVGVMGAPTRLIQRSGRNGGGKPRPD